MMKRLSAILTAALMSLTAVAATNYINATTGSDTNAGTIAAPWRTISFAITNVTPGSIINVAAGNYIQSASEVFPINIPNNISLIGAGFTGTVVGINVNSGNQSPIFRFLNTTSTYVQGFTFVNTFNGDSSDGIVFNSNSVAYFNDCKFTMNNHRAGSAVRIISGSPVFSNCIVMGNYAVNSAIQVAAGNPKFYNCNITGNWPGGVTRTGSGNPLFIDCILWRNAVMQGGCTSAMFSNSCLQDATMVTTTNKCFTSDPFLWGGYFLSCTGTGQRVHSPCFDAGSRTAVAAGQDGRTTQIDGALDTGIVDVGYHYPGGTMSGLTYYVDSSLGKDTNSGLTASAPFRSLSRAYSNATHGSVINMASCTNGWGVDVIPIQIGEGTILYGQGYSNSFIDLQGNAARAVTATGIGWALMQGITICNAPETDGSGGLRSSYSMTNLRNMRITNLRNRQAGAGIDCSFGAFDSIQNVLIDRCRSGGGGTAINVQGAMPLIYGCTIASNALTAGTSGGVSTSSGGAVDMRNTILWDNAPPSQTLLTTSMVQNCFFSDGFFNGTNGCITGNPYFVGATNYHLTSRSPCARSGTNIVLAAWDTLNLDGLARVYNSERVDMGVFTFFPLMLFYSPPATSGNTITLIGPSTNAINYKP